MIDSDQYGHLEAMWNQTQDASEILTLYDRLATPADRKWRLVAVACCRLIWPLLDQSPEARQAVEVAEAAADGAASDRDIHQAGEAVRTSRSKRGFCWFDDAYIVALVCGPHDFAEFAAFVATEGNPKVAALGACHWASRCLRRDRRLADQKDVLIWQVRDILGDPFHPVSVKDNWRVPSVLTMAEAIDRERRFAEMPILGDALEEAGCTDPTILDHCRQRTLHTHGCWLLDRILGKG